MSDVVSHLDRAIHFAGSQRKLAEAIGVTVQTISASRKRMLEGGMIAAELAVKIETHTRSWVRRDQLRPDLFEPPRHLAGPARKPKSQKPIDEGVSNGQ